MSDQHDLSETEALERAGIETGTVNHCGSCHDDSEMGYWMSGLRFLADNRDAEVCCGVRTAIQKQRPDLVELDPW